MKNLKLLSLPLTLLFVASCNEKVSPELKNSNLTSSSSTGGSSGGSSSAPTEYFIKVANASPTPLNFNLHKTGANNYNKECKVTSTLPLSNGLYASEGNASPAIDHDSKIYDVSCYYEMEELGLYTNGFKFDISASANTCDYVAYMPYSYFDRIPGDSSSTYTSVKCDNNTSAAAAQAYILANYPAGTTRDHLGATISCGQFLDQGLAKTQGVNTFRNNILTDAELCSFDYSRQPLVSGIEPGKNCDVGTIFVNEVSLATDALGVITPTPFKPLMAKRKITCSGKAANCVRGPILQSSRPDLLREIEYSPTVADQAFSKSYEYSELLTKDRHGTVEYTNFRSSLASPEVDYQQYSNNAFANAWTTDSNRKRFNPAAMEFYAANRKPGGASTDLIVSDAAFVTASVVNGYTARPFAADPFMGLTFGTTTGTVKNAPDAFDSNTINYRVNPYYVVYCLDAALDIRARIRIVARDWDRTFTSSNALEDISDYRGSTTPNLISRQDNPFDQEILGDAGALNSFNDYFDWDNMIYMQRTAGVYVLATTTYSPELGFFNTSIFTNGAF